MDIPAPYNVELSKQEAINLCRDNGITATRFLTVFNHHFFYNYGDVLDWIKNSPCQKNWNK